MTSTGNIRVGVQKGHYDGFIKIVVMTPSNNPKWFPLSPYSIRTEDGVNFENLYQSSKVYETVPKTTQHYSRWDQRVIWQRNAEVHVKDGKLTPAYKKWRDDLQDNKDWVRYPVGYGWRHKVLYSIDAPYHASLDVLQQQPHLTYIEARKAIYLKYYVELVKQVPEFKELLKMVRSGKNILIIEVDGPHQESLPYYIEKYGVESDFIENGTMLATEANLNIMLNDPKHPFGHGYCLAWALLEDVALNTTPSIDLPTADKFNRTSLSKMTFDQLKDIATCMGHDNVDDYKVGTKKGKGALIELILN